MKYYVFCKTHNGERIYINFAIPRPKVRADIPAPVYQITCPQGSMSFYSKMDIIAEAEILPAAIVGVGAGLILSLLDPLVGVAGGGAAFSGIMADEEKRVKEFNQSVG